jgi:hypothetical protein
VSLNNNLPAGLPGEFTIKLCEGSHRGLPQLWAFADHAGKQYRLVIAEGPRGLSLYEPKAGEVWRVYPDHSPNGHVVFCRLIEKLENTEGVHPLLARLQRHLDEGCTVSILDARRGADNFREGMPVSVSIEGSDLRIAITNVSLNYRAAPDFEFVAPLRHWHERSVPYGRFSFQTWSEDGSKYHVVVYPAQK